MEAAATGNTLRLCPAGFRPSSGDVMRAFPARVGMFNKYEDEGHFGYYASVRCGMKKEEKKRMKVVKELEKDLRSLNLMQINGDDGLVSEVKGQIISEAADLLLANLTKLRAEAKELKKQRKQEKAKIKAEKKAAKMNNCKDESSSSSSSETSDCEAKVLKMSSGRTLDMPTIPTPDIISDPVTTALQTENIVEEAKNICTSSIQAEEVLNPMEKIEVCMGGKCKKSGAMELMSEFEKMVGTDKVVGCKCMGKCRDGPNVRVRNESIEEGLMRVSKGPLCIGVGLEDVGSIVANFLKENKDVEIPWATA